MCESWREPCAVEPLLAFKLEASRRRGVTRPLLLGPYLPFPVVPPRCYILKRLDHPLPLPQDPAPFVPGFTLFPPQKRAAGEEKEQEERGVTLVGR